MAPIIAALANAGLTLLAEAIQKKGKKIVEKKLGVKIPDDPKELTPEKIEELHRIEIEHETDLLSLIQSAFESTAEYKKWEVIDKASARQQEVAIVTSENVPTLLKYVKPALALILTVLTFGLVYVFLFVQIPDSKKDLLNFIFGSVFGAFMTMVSYYFGSSESSSYKNKVFDVVGQLLNKKHKES